MDCEGRVDRVAVEERDKSAVTLGEREGAGGAVVVGVECADIEEDKEDEGDILKDADCVGAAVLEGRRVRDTDTVLQLVEE